MRMGSGTDEAGIFGPFTTEEYTAMGERLDRAQIVGILARVAAENPDATRFATQFLGVPACPSCDFVMLRGHVCRTKVE